MQKTAIIFSLLILSILIITGCKDGTVGEKVTNKQSVQSTTETQDLMEEYIRVSLQEKDLENRIRAKTFMASDDIANEPRADFDSNGKIDFDDFFIFVDNFGTTNPTFDLAIDGKIDFDDFFIFADNFGKSVSNSGIDEAIILMKTYLQTPLQRTALMNQIIVTTVQISSQNANEPRADFDSNGKIDFDDFMLFAEHYDENVETASSDNAVFDFTSDREIDIADFSVFADNFGKVVSREKIKQKVICAFTSDYTNVQVCTARKGNELRGHCTATGANKNCTFEIEGIPGELVHLNGCNKYSYIIIGKYEVAGYSFNCNICKNSDNLEYMSYYSRTGEFVNPDEYYVKSTATDGISSITDSCADTSNLHEAICKIDMYSSGTIVTRQAFKCPNGCRDDKCV